jgi:hypothetical protein
MIMLGLLGIAGNIRKARPWMAAITRARMILTEFKGR